MTQTTNEFEAALIAKRQAQIEEMKRLQALTHEEKEAAAKSSIVTNFGYSKPIITHKNLFKMFGENFYFLPIPLGWDDAIEMGGAEFIPVKQFNTKQLSEYGYSFYVNPYDERVAGTRVGAYGRKNDTPIDRYFFDLFKTVKGRTFDDQLGMQVEVPYKNLNYKVKPVQMSNTVLIPGIVLIKHDLNRMVTRNVLKEDENGNQVLDADNRPIYETKNVEFPDFYVAEVGDIFEKGKNTLKEGVPKYKVIFLEINSSQKEEYDKLRERYKNNILQVKYPDGTYGQSDYNCKHHVKGCVLQFSKQGADLNTKYSIKDLPLNGLLVETKKVGDKQELFPTALGREVRDALLEVVLNKESWESYSIKLKEVGRELTHFDLIRHLSSLPTLGSMGLLAKMIGHQQIDFVIDLMKESVEDFLKSTFPERYGAVVVDAVQQHEVPLSQTIPLTIPLVPQKQLPPATNPNDVASGDEMGDDLPF